MRMPPMTSTAEPLRIVMVSRHHQLHCFIRVPWSIHAEDTAWALPLLVERRDQLSQPNPYFAHPCTFLGLPNAVPIPSDESVLRWPNYGSPAIGMQPDSSACSKPGKWQERDRNSDSISVHREGAQSRAQAWSRGSRVTLDPGRQDANAEYTGRARQHSLNATGSMRRTS